MAFVIIIMINVMYSLCMSKKMYLNVAFNLEQDEGLVFVHCPRRAKAGTSAVPEDNTAASFSSTINSTTAAFCCSGATNEHSHVPSVLS